MTLPTHFVSHGAPTLALEDTPVTQAWTRLADGMAPKAVVAVSAHWDTPVPAVTSAPRLPTIHDFYGFPQPLYHVRYEPPGAPEIAERVTTLLAGAGFAAASDPARGIDHGAWVPMKFAFPRANVPTIQLSVQSGHDASHHLAVGRALAPLREEGVLILASGGLVHSLRELDWHATGGRVMEWARDFGSWVAARVDAHDADSLAGWMKLAPQPRRAHPTPEHFLPFFVALGAGGFPARRIDLGYDLGSLGMDAFAFGIA